MRENSFGCIKNILFIQNSHFIHKITFLLLLLTDGFADDVEFTFSFMFSVPVIDCGVEARFTS